MAANQYGSEVFNLHWLMHVKIRKESRSIEDGKGRSLLRRMFRWGVLMGVAVFVLLCVSYLNVEVVSAPFVSDEMEDLPNVEVALVPGTSKFLKSGKVNQYFAYRINAAVALYKHGKVKHFLISGDHGRSEYNEPEDMRISLIEAGIPDSVITLDYAGFDTYDSMIRAKKVFGQQHFIVVSQDFQNERAVYIARSFGIEAWGYNAQAVTYRGGFLTKVREFFARGKANVEVLLGIEPTYLGEKIQIN